MAAIKNLKVPILFNPLKHHLDFIRNYVHNYDQKDYDRLKYDLRKIGESQMDLYYGELTIVKIMEEVTAFLTNFNLLNRKVFFSYLQQNNGFAKILLSDGSTWVLRKGEDPTKYIHIHPGRYSKYTIRIKSTTLKSAIAATTVSKGASRFGLNELNRVRVKILKFSPVKSISLKTQMVLDLLKFGSQKQIGFDFHDDTNQ